MTVQPQPDAWRKSSYSGPDSNCVELPHTLDAVRDSKNGQVLVLDRRRVTALLNEVKRSR